MDLQYAVPIARLDAVVLNGLRKVEGARKFSRHCLDAVIFDAIGRLFKLSLAAERQCSVLYLQIEIFFFHSWKLCPNEVGILAFENIHWRNPNPSRRSRIRQRATESVVE